MKRTLIASILGLALTFSGKAMADTTLPLDPSHTSVTFTVAHLSITKVEGTVPLAASHLVVNKNEIPVSAQASFDLNKLDTRDENRNKDLREDKWFNTAMYPTMSFKSTSIVPGANGEFTMNGMLTLHGQTHAIVLDGMYTGKASMMGKTHFGYTLTGKIDRTAWGVGNAPAAIVGNDINITIQAEAIQ